jgi:hypothetical protein
MTRTLEDLLTEAGLSTTYKHSSGTLVIPLAQYARFAALVRADERERCALFCEAQHEMIAESLDGFDIAAAIRALKEQQ